MQQIGCSLHKFEAVWKFKTVINVRQMTYIKSNVVIYKNEENGFMKKSYKRRSEQMKKYIFSILG